MRSFFNPTSGLNNDTEKHPFLATLGGINLSLSDAIAFCDLKFEEQKCIDEKELTKKTLTLKELYEEKQMHVLALEQEIKKAKDNKQQSLNLNTQKLAEKKLLSERIAAYNEENHRLQLLKQENIAINARNTAINKLKHDQRQIAYQLAYVFETGRYHHAQKTQGFGLLQYGIYGNQDVTKDAWKAAHYLAQATDATGNPSEKIRPTTAYHYLGWYTSTRLFTLRLNRILDFSDHAFTPTFTKVVFPFAYLGFSYALELIVDLAVLAKTWWKGESVKAALVKDGRASRMANAAVWLACNIICFVFTAGLINIVASLAAFTFDVFNEYYRARCALKKFEGLRNSVANRIKELEQSMIYMPSEAEREELIKLRTTHIELNNKIKSVKESSNWTIGCSILIVVGMVLFFFPPAIIPYAALIGATLAFTSGSIGIGLGRKIKNAITSSSTYKGLKQAITNRVTQFKIWFNPATPKPELTKKSEPQLSAQPQAKPSSTIELTELKSDANISIQTIIKKVAATDQYSFTSQILALDNAEITYLRILLGLSQHDQMWQDQLKRWATYSQIKRVDQQSTESKQSVLPTLSPAISDSSFPDSPTSPGAPVIASPAVSGSSFPDSPVSPGAQVLYSPSTGSDLSPVVAKNSSRFFGNIRTNKFHCTFLETLEQQQQDEEHLAPLVSTK
jgi:hypothetical protein